MEKGFQHLMDIISEARPYKPRFLRAQYDLTGELTLITSIDDKIDS
jgi:hypothetical protein